MSSLLKNVVLKLRTWDGIEGLQGSWSWQDEFAVVAMPSIKKFDPRPCYRGWGQVFRGFSEGFQGITRVFENLLSSFLRSRLRFYPCRDALDEVWSEQTLVEVTLDPKQLPLDLDIEIFKKSPVISWNKEIQNWRWRRRRWHLFLPMTALRGFESGSFQNGDAAI